jgi:hypothetical protein
MSLTEDQKLNFVKLVFCDRIMEVQTLVEMKTLVKNISPAGVKSFLLAKLEKIRLEKEANAATEMTLEADLSLLKEELNSL